MRRSPAAPPQPGSKSVLPCVATVPKVREDTPMALDSIPDSSSCAEKFSREPRHSATAPRTASHQSSAVSFRTRGKQLPAGRKKSGPVSGAAKLITYTGDARTRD